jgi:hypothetical protein
MTYRGLATLLLRCSGLISIVISLFHAAGYSPLIWDLGWVGRGATGSGSALRNVILPILSGVGGGLAVFLLAGPLARLASRGLE